MPRSTSQTVMLDLTNTSSRRIIDVRGVDILSITTAMASVMGTGVVELMMSVGGKDVSYAPSKVLNSSTSSIMSVDVNGIDEAVLVVQISDPTAASITARTYGEETQ